jgi:formylglycine-generating enzyme required for sulfatase activity
MPVRTILIILVSALLLGSGIIVYPTAVQTPSPPATTPLPSTPTPVVSATPQTGALSADELGRCFNEPLVCLINLVVTGNPWLAVVLIGVVIALAVIEPWRTRFVRWFDRLTGGQKRDIRDDAEREWEREEIVRQLTDQKRQQQAPAGRERYLQRLERDMRRMAKIPALGREQRELNLEQVYIPLYVVERKQIERFQAYLLGKDDSRREAYKAVDTSQPVFRLLSEPNLLPKTKSEKPADPEQTTTRLLLVGRAGSGKTTTLHYGALVLAQAWRDKRGLHLIRERLELFTDHCPFPIYARLTELMTYVRNRYQAQDLVGAPASVLLDALDELVRRDVPDLPTNMVSDWVKEGGCVLMLDGLDETGDAEERGHTIDLINSLVREYPHNRYLLASRPFEGLSERLSGFVERHLRPLDADDIKRLLNNLFRALRLPAEQAADEYHDPTTLVPEAAELWQSLERNPRLFDMATNPLLLTSMAVLVEGREPLPVERAKIYEKLVRLTIEAWRKAQLSRDRPGVVVRLFEESDDSVRLRLQLLAAAMLEKEQREVTLTQAREVLRPVYRANNPDWNDERCDAYIRELLAQLALHSGLLQARDIDSLFSFAHFTLQEYLAARYYTEQGRDKEEKVRRLVERWAEPRWRETILLAIGHEATSGSRETAQHMIRQLLATGHPEAIILAGDGLDEANARTVGELTPQRVEVANRLRELAALTPAWRQVAHPDPVVRNRAALILDRLGEDNDRPGLDPTRADYWAERIEAGEFSMGDDEGLYDSEKPQFIYRINRPFALARFPVTNRQYLRFLEALAGRGDQPTVNAAQQVLTEWRQAELSDALLHPPFWSGARYRPGEGNLPVVGVTWYAASAFARWVDIWLHTIGVLSTGEEVRLPSEAEWERAAAYPVVLPASAPRAGRRTYPWGKQLTATPASSIVSSIEANVGASGINHPSVVGIFPHGAAACGAEDMAGNVWEWCSTRYVPYPLGADIKPKSFYNLTRDRTFVLRGGSWDGTATHARCAFRGSRSPGDGGDNWGFRLARLFS